MQAPMHSTSSSENIPSLVTSLWPMFEFLSDVLENLVAAAKHARNIRANLDVKFSERLAMQHRVVRECFLNLNCFQIEAARNFGNQLVADEAEFILPVEQHRN